MKEQKPT